MSEERLKPTPFINMGLRVAKSMKGRFSSIEQKVNHAVNEFDYQAQKKADAINAQVKEGVKEDQTQTHKGYTHTLPSSQPSQPVQGILQDPEKLGVNQQQNRLFQGKFLERLQGVKQKLFSSQAAAAPQEIEQSPPPALYSDPTIDAQQRKQSDPPISYP